jgi:glycosyltransferase involved in cell wall biosynthesis
MRIAYVTLHWPRTPESSIGQKIIRQMQNWHKAGHEVHFFSHMHSVPPEVDLVDGEYFIYMQRSGFVGRIQSEFSRIRAVRELILAVREYCPDLIYLRWSMYVFPVHRLLKVAPTIVEVNTNDFEEHKLLGFLPDLYNRMTRGLLLGLAAGHSFATAEMAELPVFRKYQKPGVVITNSLDLVHTPSYPAPRNSPPHLLFIGTPGMPWHGEEKLIPLAESFPDLIIDIMGIDRMGGVSSLPDNIRLHGFLSGQDYEAVLAQADAAIGTLSLHKKGMEEAATFKIRDCVARGIPCILPYVDTDLDDLESEYFLHIPNSEDNIQTHGQVIHDFVYSMRGKRIPRELIVERIDSSVKESKRLSFFQQFIKE